MMVFLAGGAGVLSGLHVLDVLAGTYTVLYRHRNGARRERSPTFSVNISISCGAFHGKLSIIFGRLKRDKTDILRMLHRLFYVF